MSTAINGACESKSRGAIQNRLRPPAFNIGSREVHLDLLARNGEHPAHAPGA